MWVENFDNNIIIDDARFFSDLTFKKSNKSCPDNYNVGHWY